MIILRKQIAGLNERSLARFTASARRAAGVSGQVNVVVASSREVHELNRCFRGKDESTDVLSFPPIAAVRSGFAGDVVISAEIARENAKRLGHQLADEVKILILHGVLHLGGYDHERDRGRMARKEARLRRELGLPDSLIARAEGGSPSARARGPRARTVGEPPALQGRRKR